MTHTPGPWFVGFSPDIDGESGEYGPDVYDSEVGVFAVIDGEPETVAQPYLEADACLIAAAPEMLEALEAIMGFVLSRRRTGIKGPASAQEARLIYARCMGAIRKARGVDEASVPDCIRRLSRYAIEHAPVCFPPAGEMEVQK